MSSGRDQGDGTRAIGRSGTPTTPRTPAATRVTTPRTDPDRTEARDIERFLAMVGVRPGLDWPDAPANDGENLVAARYQQVEVLGRGGLGEVLLVWDRDLARHVAFKRLRPEHRNNPVLVQAFLEEAIITGRLEHPHIVPIHDLGVNPGDGPFYTMKRLTGASLAASLSKLRASDESAQREFTLAQRVTVFVRVLRAIAHAHGRGIIHCDLKPSNIILGTLGEVTVVDWGLAIALGDNAMRQARARMWSGSPGYMAPEQSLDADIAKLGTHTDIWSLGAILYELMALCVPQAGVDGRLNTTDTVAADEGERRIWAPIVPLGQRDAVEIPPALLAVCERALAEDPARRHGSVLDMLAEVEDWLTGRQADERRDAEIIEARRTAREATALLAQQPRQPSPDGVVVAAIMAATGAIARALVLAPEHAETRAAGSELYWQLFRALHAVDAASEAVVTTVHEALDNLAELGIPTNDPARIDAWFAAIERLAAEGLPRVSRLLGRIRALARTDLFGGLAGHDLRNIAENLDDYAWPANNVIFRAGDVGDALWILVAGEVAIEADGQHLTTLAAPACFGEVALVPALDGSAQRRTADARTVGSATALRLSAERFEALARRHGAIALGVMRLLAARLRSATERELARRG
jgi:serine/threonine protein kinase